MDLITEEKSPSSQQGSLVNRIALLESVRRLVMSVISGEKSSESWARCNPDGSWARTSQASSLPSLEDSSVEWSMTWPKWGIAWDGGCMELKTLEQCIVEIEYLSLPTPVASEGVQRSLIPKTDVFRVSNQRVVRVDKNGVEWQAGVMQSALVQMMLPTPRANQAMAVDLESNYAQNHKHQNLEVVIAKEMLPTPRSSQAISSPLLLPKNGENQSRLEYVIAEEMLPTPSTFDALDFKKKNLEDKTTKNGKRGGRSNLREVDFTKLSGEEIGEAGESRRYVLNPQFVEAMMGFPTGWTDLRLSETP